MGFINFFLFQKLNWSDVTDHNQIIITKKTLIIFLRSFFFQSYFGRFLIAQLHCILKEGWGMGAFPQKSYTGIWPNYKSEMFKYDYSVIKRGGEA